MITITIHGLSFMVGMIFGLFIAMCAIAKLFYDDRWNDGFGAGYRSGVRNREDKANE